MKTCPSCQHFDATGSQCGYNPTHVPIATPEVHWCGHFKPQATTFASDMAGPAEKVSDKEILDWFETFPDHTDRDRIGPILAAKFGITERTAKERLRRLQMLGILRCAQASDPRPGDKPFWQFAQAHPDEEKSREWWGAILASQKPRGWALLAGKGRVRDFTDIEPAFNALSADSRNPKTFSDLFRAQSQLSSMGRSTFSRLLTESVAANRLVRTSAGLYHLNDSKPITP